MEQLFREMRKAWYDQKRHQRTIDIMHEKLIKSGIKKQDLRLNSIHIGHHAAELDKKVHERQ